LYGGRPSEEELAAFGAELEDVTGDVDVWPDNEETVKVFTRIGTQWRHGMAGVTGLVYEAVWPVMRVLRIPRANWLDVFEGVRVMEGAVLGLVKEARANG